MTAPPTCLREALKQPLFLRQNTPSGKSSKLKGVCPRSSLGRLALISHRLQPPLFQKNDGSSELDGPPLTDEQQSWDKAGALLSESRIQALDWV